jgi:hypothetical protein
MINFITFYGLGKNRRSHSFCVPLVVLNITKQLSIVAGTKCENNLGRMRSIPWGFVPQAQIITVLALNTSPAHGT